MIEPGQQIVVHARHDRGSLRVWADVGEEEVNGESGIGRKGIARAIGIRRTSCNLPTHRLPTPDSTLPQPLLRNAVATALIDS